jgi:hypothetical protein
VCRVCVTNKHRPALPDICGLWNRTRSPGTSGCGRSLASIGGHGSSGRQGFRTAAVNRGRDKEALARSLGVHDYIDRGRGRASCLSRTNRQRCRRACDCRADVMAHECVHAVGIRDVTPSALGCEECLKIGSPWAHLRLCWTSAMSAAATARQTVTPPSIFARPAIPSSKATIRRKGGDGAMSMKLVWTLTAARRRITDQFRGTIKFAAWGNRAANSSRDVHAVSRHPDHLQLDCI